jgi:alkanesulfonate monooxygenase SsuD/methylene tetrahydromethanopterin reductase-like flavin-dependent oxidoreductase (luciferase family)
MEVGYKLASEEQGPNELVRYAGLAEEYGFGFVLILAHFHPWIDRQGLAGTPVCGWRLANR